jgi:hypothetical protein
MPGSSDLARRIIVLQRAPGYLRLELPAELCGPAVAAALEAGMGGLPGLKSAGVDRGWRRMSIRWEDDACSVGDAARHLFGLLPGLLEEATAGVSPEGHGAPVSAARGGFQPLLDRLAAAISPADAPAGSLQARMQPVLASALTEKAIINFFNDIVAFYLIKAHWDLITRRWLQSPLAHSNAWLTVFYLVFLLVRYRKSG